ncbi:armadillo/beta-catenin-like repeat and C2domain-containing protein [Striga asiatica]|uniref:Armadillo/beta-catenin-like repeat and C2domain-containing protein n=1 Tax=Striga asiatica TaxID=4170 RepID=A0A5A7PWI9_STRAF|nr:armadillo/beta-catenin-like repeat and C2domain-containing protein [Striga asiatica]
MDDPEKTRSRVGQLIDQLQSSTSSPHEKELTTARLLGIARARKEARALIGSHAQALPLFISILWGGTQLAKINVASTLSVLCREDELRVKVLLGGCIPPLLSLLKSSAEARKAAAEALCQVSLSSGGHVGMKIFVTEGVVPTLWDQLTVGNDRVVEGFVAGALRNLCGDHDGHWQATLDSGGAHVIVGLLRSDNLASSQSNAASLLARLALAFPDGIPKIIDSGAVEPLIRLLGPQKDVLVRASAAEALAALSSESAEGKKVIADAQGVPVLIGAVVAPSKEGLQGEWARALQDHSTRALAHICGGMPALLLYLGELSQSPRLAAPVADIIGALAYALTVFELGEDGEPFFESAKVENILIMLLKPRDNRLVQERLLEALAGLYGNSCLSGGVINNADAKMALVGLITMAIGDTQEYLIVSLIKLCTEEVSVWEALGKREGIQILISALGLSGEKNQEYAVEMLAILTQQLEDSKWAITAAGGIPPLIRLVQVGSHKARLDATHILWKLGCHGEDIRACVESAGAIPAFLWLLKNGEPKGQEAAAVALLKLVRVADSSTVNQLLAMLVGNSPSSKGHVIKVLGHVLSRASLADLVEKGAFGNVGLRSLVQVLNSSNDKTQEYAAAVLADLFRNRQDIRDGLAADEVISPCLNLLARKPHIASRGLGALSGPAKIKTNSKTSCIVEGDVRSLIKVAKTASIDFAENAMAALVNLLSDRRVAVEALAEDVVTAITKILHEGSLEGKMSASRALYQLLKRFHVSDVLTGRSQCRFAILAVVDSLNAMDIDSKDAIDALEVVDLLSRTRQGLNEVPSSLGPLVRCLCEGPPQVQDKVIGILSRLSRDQPVLLGDLLVSNSRSIGALAGRVTKSNSLEVRVGGTALLICAAKEHRSQSMDALGASGYMKPLTHALLEMIKQNPTSSYLEIEVRTPRGYRDRSAFRNGNEFDVSDPATVLGGTVALWLLSIVSSSYPKNKSTVMESGGLDPLFDKLARHANRDFAELEDTEGLWISTVLAAILFQDANVVSSPMAIGFVQPLATLLKANEIIDRFFAVQAMASLASHGNKGINLAIANTDAVEGIITLVGHLGPSDMPNLLALSDEFGLVRNPDQVVLENLFRIDDVRVGSLARKTIPCLVDLLRPMADRPGAPLVSISLLTQIADGDDGNKLVMAEAGVLDALTKYLSLSPQDLTEATISELLRILFSNHHLLRYKAAISCMVQLIAVLQLGSRNARLSAVRALNELFDADHIRNSDSSMQAVQPLADMLGSTSECEQAAALSALLKLTSDNDSKVAVLVEAGGNPLRSLHKILSSHSSSLELKTDAAELCCALFGNPRVREIMPVVSEWLEPLIFLMKSDRESAVESGVCAFERLLDDDERQVEITSDHDFVGLLVSLVSGSNYRVIEASISSLINLGKDRTPRKLDMVNAGIIDKCLDLLPNAPNSACAMIAELFRILTNSSAVSKSPSAAKIVEPLFVVVLRTDIGLWGQDSALQALVNILEKPQSLSALKLSPSEVIEPLISFLESPSQAIQQLGTELLSHLLAQEHFKQDITMKAAAAPLVQLAGIGIPDLQHTAIKALEKISLSWPEEVFDAGGVLELSKVVVQDVVDGPLWECAASVVSNLVQLDAEYYLGVPVEALVKMLRSTSRTTVRVALNSLIIQHKTKISSAEAVAEAGAIDSLLDLLRSHECEEGAARLLEALLNSRRVREMKAAKHAIAALAHYLVDPRTVSETARLLAALALGDLSQHEGLARASDSAAACRALVEVLRLQRTEEMKMVAVCALHNFVMKSRSNRRAVAEAGGVESVQEMLLCPNPELSTATANEEVLRTINVVFSNFPKLIISEAATLCIPHLISALKSGGEVAQDSVLSTLCLLKQSWSANVTRSQAMIAAEAIPTLQMLLKTGPPSFHDRLESLLSYLPGCLTVFIGRANNLKHGGTSAFCRLAIGNCPSRRTKVVSHNTSPEWKERFMWAFDVPPKGQKLQIDCRSRSRSTFGKTSHGRVTIQIDNVVTEGVTSGVFSLSHDNGQDSSSRTLELEITCLTTQMKRNEAPFGLRNMKEKLRCTMLKLNTITTSQKFPYLTEHKFYWRKMSSATEF